MCGRNLKRGLLVLLFLLGSWGGFCWAEERPPVVIPYQTWVLLQERITTLGSALDELTLKLNEQEKSLLSERQAYEKALVERNERVKTLTDSLMKASRSLSWFAAASVTVASSAVSVGPGQTTLTVMPWRACSRASVFENATRPPLQAA